MISGDDQKKNARSLFISAEDEQPRWKISGCVHNKTKRKRKEKLAVTLEAETHSELKINTQLFRILRKRSAV